MDPRMSRSSSRSLGASVMIPPCGQASNTVEFREYAGRPQSTVHPISLAGTRSEDLDVSSLIALARTVNRPYR